VWFRLAIDLHLASLEVPPSGEGLIAFSACELPPPRVSTEPLSGRYVRFRM
jgi:hypothetical protein